jgi:hypothetical protein
MKLSKPFSEYVSVEKLPVRGGGATKFVVVFPFQIEGTDKIETRRLEWPYSGTQAAVDEKAGVDGLTPRHRRALEHLQRVIENELKASGGRIYETPGQKIPVWGKKK